MYEILTLTVLSNTMKFQKNNRRYIITVICLFLTSISCNKERLDFPYVPINISINLAILDAEVGPGEHKFMYDQEGVRGLIIARNFDNQYFVYDRACTYEKDFSCSVQNDTTSLLHLCCPCCESQFFLDPSDSYGEAYVTRGPARYSLMKYTSFINSGFLVIRN